MVFDQFMELSSNRVFDFPTTLCIEGVAFDELLYSFSSHTLSSACR
jgi:hypothetical protein